MGINQKVAEVLAYVDRAESSLHTFCFDRISQKELDLICQMANEHLELSGRPERVVNHMGEISFGILPQHRNQDPENEPGFGDEFLSMMKWVLIVAFTLYFGVMALGIYVFFIRG